MRYTNGRVYIPPRRPEESAAAAASSHFGVTPDPAMFFGAPPGGIGCVRMTVLRTSAPIFEGPEPPRAFEPPPDLDPTAHFDAPEDDPRSHEAPPPARPRRMQPVAGP